MQKVVTKMSELREKIEELKRQKNAVVLVHNYQRPEIYDVADFLGDSLGLSKQAADTEADIIVFCGVNFMAETAKILSPERKVLLPRPASEVNCPMADMVSAGGVREMREKYPDAAVVAYVNTTAKVKAEADICCTSSNAIQVVRSLEEDEVIFVPDRNLGNYVQRYVNKKIIPWEGYCYVHNRIDESGVRKAQENYPESELLVHPECRGEVIDLADRVESTAGMVERVRTSEPGTFLIGTEQGLVNRLEQLAPESDFYTAGTPRVCSAMKQSRLTDVLTALEEEKYEVDLPEDIRERAAVALERMIEVG